ncbi:hypothetical protein H0H87_012424 [Tephrocybe sp. NHM501043]|nr:hypothetical protein H0H87_012424 [Tephrocybe sp. NHM501043]
MPSLRQTPQPEKDDPPVDADSRRLALAATLATLEKKCHSEPSTPNLAALTSHGALADMKEVTIEVLIDQEVGGDGHEIAKFRPTKRQAFNFHYAALEALPVLRRITLNGDESRDYISRQASLGLKSSGVYVVHGHETPAFPASRGGAPTKLQWKFEYLVDDRHADVSGNLLSDGEKVLTPLSFSCSPMLLHPLQGKRVRLMHVMKKSVIPKLVAEKMEPPSLGSKIPMSPQKPDMTSMCTKGQQLSGFRILSRK